MLLQLDSTWSLPSLPHTPALTEQPLGFGKSSWAKERYWGPLLLVEGLGQEVTVISESHQEHVRAQGPLGLPQASLDNSSSPYTLDGYLHHTGCTGLKSHGPR